jgi:hypothetical protein
MFQIENRSDLELVKKELAEWMQSQRMMILRLDVQHAVKEQTGSCNEEAVSEFEKGVAACQVAIAHLKTMIGAIEQRRGAELVRAAGLNGVDKEG